MNSPMGGLNSNLVSIEHQRTLRVDQGREADEEVSFRVSEPQPYRQVATKESLAKDTSDPEEAFAVQSEQILDQVDSSTSSPAERRLHRRIQKESSPVRAFLNNPRDEKFEDVMIEEPFQISELQAVTETQSPAGGSSIVPGEPIPAEIQVSRMSDRPDKPHRD